MYDFFKGKITFFSCLLHIGRYLSSIHHLSSLSFSLAPHSVSSPFSPPVRNFSCGRSYLTYIVTYIVPSLSLSNLSFWTPLTLSLSPCVSLVQIIQDRVDSHVSRNRLLWNSLPGGLYALPQYSTDPAQFPFYYAILGKFLMLPSGRCRHCHILY